MPVREIITKDGTRIEQMLAQNVEVEFGFLGSKAEAVHAEGGGLTVVDIATIHEYGDPASHIPARSMIGDYIDLHTDEIFDDFTNGFMAAFDGTVSYEQAMNAVAAVHVGGMQTRMADGIPPALSPFTIEMRRQSGRGSLDPKDTLIVTGQMRSSMSWLVRFLSAGAGGMN